MARCVQCGYCCTKNTCMYGTWDVEKQQCTQLTEDRQCAKYDEILKHEEGWFYPMFNSGCSSSVCNAVRAAKIRKDRIGEQT